MGRSGEMGRQRGWAALQWSKRHRHRRGRSRLYYGVPGASGAEVHAGGGTSCRVGGLGSEPGQLRSPTGIVVGPDGRIYVTESGGHRVQVFSSEGTFLDTWGALGDGPGEFASAMTVALDNDMRIYVSDWGNSRVQVFDNDGRYLHQIGGPGTGLREMTNPTGVAIGPEGDLWVMDRGNSRIQRFKRDGTFVQLWTQAGRGGLQVADQHHLRQRRQLVGIRVYRALGAAIQPWRRAVIRACARHIPRPARTIVRQYRRAICSGHGERSGTEVPTFGMTSMGNLAKGNSDSVETRKRLHRRHA